MALIEGWVLRRIWQELNPVGFNNSYLSLSIKKIEMTSLIIACFDSEEEAIEISRKLTQLENLGEITIFEKVVVRRNRDGTASVVQADITDGLRSISGLALDTLASVLGGPVGMTVGILSGNLAGRSRDANYFGFSDDFESKLLSTIFPGDVSIVAELDENKSSKLNSVIAGRIIMNNVDYEYQEYAESEIEAVDEEISMKRIRMKSANATERSLLFQRIIDLKEKRRRKLADLDRKTKELAAKQNSPAFIDRAKNRAAQHELKISRLKNRIEKHQFILAELRNELKHLESVHTK